MSLSALQDFTFYSKYSRKIKDENRKETYKEAVTRVKEMMYEKYAQFNIKDDIDWAYDFVYNKKVLGSQRILQFGGSPVLKHNARGYNCCASYIDRLRFFQEAMYLLLCGCGTGFSVQRCHIDKLPDFCKSQQVNRQLPFIDYVIDDSIEGWADSIGVLLDSYFNEENAAIIRFIFDKIRKKGSFLSSSSGTAPGPEPLAKALEKIREILENKKRDGRLRPIDAYDIVMHESDAVLSGGVRRSSALCMFSPDDEEMYNAKIGNWFYKNPQRGRSNNSAVLLRDSTSFSSFQKLIESTKNYGEPGFIWTDHLDNLYNPCQPSWAKILTEDGIREFKDIDEGTKIWSKEGWTTVIKKWSTGLNRVYKYITTAGIFYGTENHRLISNKKKVRAKDCKSIDIITGPYGSNIKLNNQDIIDGIVFGDGSVHIASNNKVYLCIGKNDYDYFTSDIKDYIKEKLSISSTSYDVITTITNSELPLTFNRIVPNRFLNGSKEKICGFLRGLYSANGSVCDNRITLKSSSLNVIEDVQIMLSSIGIMSYYTTNKPTIVKFKNGKYLCKQSYDLNISVDRNKFVELIGFVQQYKNNKIKIKINKRKQTTYKIISVNLISEEETFDITVDNNSHTYWTQGCDVSNCVEAGLYAKSIDGQSGWQFCNLCSLNGKKIKDKETFLEFAKAAATIGTLQAGFTDFPYLGVISEEITKREALLGVSITGVMENSEVLLNAKNQRIAAEVIKDKNNEIAKKININPAARLTNLKPEGTTSCFLGTCSGIHPHHAKRYFRTVQANTDEEIYKYFKSVNPEACEKGYWSNNGTDDVIRFCIEVEKGSKLKNDLPAIELLKAVKLTQSNWVEAGTIKERLSHPTIKHNVSNTINVKPEEWDEVTKFIYNNRAFYAGISLLPVSGDKDYIQAPFCAIYTPKEMIEHYGDASMFCSGLIEDAISSFDNLWLACDAALGLCNGLNEAKNRWIERLKKFAHKYFEEDVKRTTYLLKDIYNWKLWLDLCKSYKDVDYTQLNISKQTNYETEMACAGGKCDLY